MDSLFKELDKLVLLQRKAAKEQFAFGIVVGAVIATATEILLFGIILKFFT